MPPPITAAIENRRSNSAIKHTHGPTQEHQASASVSRDSLFGEPRQPRPSATSPVQAQAGTSRPRVSGLGLYIESTRNDFADKLSAAARFAVDQSVPGPTSSHMTPTELASEQSGPVRASPSRIFSEHIARQRSQAMALAVPTVPTIAGVGPVDLEQSATEVATPSLTGSTPALKAADDAMDQIKAGVEILHQDVAKLQPSPRNTAQGFGAASQRPQQQNVLPDNNAYKQTPLARPRKDSDPSTLDTLIATVCSLRHLLAQTPNLGVSVARLGQRIDVLESASFAHSTIEEHAERFEHVDGRIIDIEGRVEELEKFWEDCIESAGSIRSESPAVSRSGLLGARLNDDPTPLVDMRIYHRIVDQRATVIQRLRILEDRLSNLSDPLPAATPLPTVEVVLLPWGKHLKGIWHDPSDPSQASGNVAQPSAAEITQTASMKPLGDRSNKPTSDHQMADSIFKEWPYADLAAKAVGPSAGIAGRIYERLNSRGFVRSVTFEDDSAKGAHTAICTAFSDVLQHEPPTKTGHPEKSSLATSEQPNLIALRSPFIPLRKVHKDSRLRFLSEPELSTPALWNLHFLDSSVFMHARSTGVSRLFITTPSAYLQNDVYRGWSWQKLRELPRVSDSDVELDEEVNHSQADAPEVPEADALEPCWAHDPKLDPSESQGSSLAASVSFESSHHPSPPRTKVDEEVNSDEEVGDPNYEQEEDQDDNDASGLSAFSSDESHRRSHHPITPISDLHASSRPAVGPRRSVTDPLLTSSMPHISVMQQPHPKRQAASFNHPSSSNPEVVSLPRPLSSLSKRRRLSRTPSGRWGADEEPTWALTPRRSHDAGRRSRSREEDEADAEAVYERYIATHSKSGPAERVPLKEKKTGPYATPYSFGVTRRADIELTDEDSDSSFDSNDEAMNDASSDDEDEADPAFADEVSRSPESEMEIDEAITLQEEAWTGADDDDMDDVFETGKRRRVGHKRRKTGPRRKAAPLEDEDEEEDNDQEEEGATGHDDADEDAFEGFDDDDEQPEQQQAVEGEAGRPIKIEEDGEEDEESEAE